jgi:hypothetical protein
MALPTGTISMSQVNVELGRTSTASISLNETAVRTLAGVASGTISMNNLRGKSAQATFSPAGGTTAGTAVPLSDLSGGGSAATVTITCSESATWTYTRSGTFGTPATGSQTATSITFSLTNTTTFIRSSTWTVSATAGSTTRYWTVELTNEGFA